MLDSAGKLGPHHVKVDDPNDRSTVELDALPNDWANVRLEDVCERPTYGYTAAAVREPVGPKLLRITDIQDGRVTWSSVPHVNAEQIELAKYSLRRGDLLVARIGATTGKSYLVRDCPAAVFASYLIRIRAKQSIDSEFLAFFTESVP